MLHSPDLLDLALESIEQWSQIKSAQYGSYKTGFFSSFLWETSYSDHHSQRDHHHISGERILMNAMEAAILNHAQEHSEWWQKNRERLSFSTEGALCYFAILALINSPQPNLSLIGNLLCDKGLLESELSYELGTLIQTAFIYLSHNIQDAIMATIRGIWDRKSGDERNHIWILKEQAEYVSTIPCHLRSTETQAILDTYQETHGMLIRQPSIGTRGGVVSAPFSYEVFLNVSNEGVLRLLTHYAGHHRDSADFLIGGEESVGGQLREASSRHPSRFLSLLISHWPDISARFRDEVMDGVANYIAHRYGNLQANAAWLPVEEPSAPILVNQILDELERHPLHWQLNRSAARTLQACAYVILDTPNAARLVFLATGFANLSEESTIRGGSLGLYTIAINMITGKIAEALMILVCNFQKHSITLPELLPPTLRQFACNEHPAIRALILTRLPYLQSKNPELGWELFYLVMKNGSGLWQSAERCLYYAYHEQFEKVAPLLERIFREGNAEDMETWGRLSALSALSGHVDFTNFLDDLNALGITEAWLGASSVWSHTENIRQHRKQCLAGMEVGLKADTPQAIAITQYVDRIFRETSPPISLPETLLQLCFSVFEKDSENKHRNLFGFEEWLNAISQRKPELALAAAETYLAYVSNTKSYFYDHDNQLVQLMTRLFAEAEEREESDGGNLLQRVVSLQDLLLSLGVNSMNEWLKAAERQ